MNIRRWLTDQLSDWVDQDIRVSRYAIAGALARARLEGRNESSMPYGPEIRERMLKREQARRFLRRSR